MSQATEPGAPRPLLAAVVLSGVVGAIVGGSSAWAIYHQYGPVDRIVSNPVVTVGGGKSGTAAAPTYASLAQQVAPSLVTIVTRPATASDIVAGQAHFGTGFVATSDGLVVTSAAALSGASRLRLAYADGEVIDASVAGSDRVHGVVVLRAAQAPANRPASLGFADFSQRAPRAGDLVIAVGSRTLSGVSVTAGTVTAAGCAAQVGGGGSASSTSVIGGVAVDATAAPEDDGAPLLDGTGKVVGVVTAGGTGSGLEALDGRSAAQLVAALEQGVTTPPASFGAVGCVLDAAHAGAVGARAGALVMAVTSAGPADVAGLRAGDVVTSVDATTIDAEHPLDATALNLSRGQQVRVGVVRDGQDQTLSLTVG